MVDSVINTSGVIEANSVGMRNGQIVLGAATADTEARGRADARPCSVSGTLSAAGKQKGTKGGKIVVTGENIEVTGATHRRVRPRRRRQGDDRRRLGRRQAGQVAASNNQSAELEAIAIPNATTVSVDARDDASTPRRRERGDGGKVILWADDTTELRRHDPGARRQGVRQRRVHRDIRQGHR